MEAISAPARQGPHQPHHELVAAPHVGPRLQAVAEHAQDRRAKELHRRVERDPAAQGEQRPFEVELARTAHPVETYAIRLTAGGRSQSSLRPSS